MPELTLPQLPVFVLPPQVDSNVLAIIAAVLVALAGLCMVGAVLPLVQQRRMRRQLATFAAASAIVEAAPATETGPLVAFAPLGSHVARFLSPSILRALSRQLQRAGEPRNTTVEQLLGLRVVIWVVALISILITLFAPGASDINKLFAGLLGVTALVIVDALLLSIAQRRRKAMERALPTLVDLTYLALVAGMGLDIAIGTVAARLRGPLSDELLRYIRLVTELGVSRRSALASLAMRSNSAEIAFFTEALATAMETGSGLVGTLSGQSQLLNETRQREAEADAQRAPVRMMFPMVAFILPVVMLIIIGPVVLRLMGVARAGGM